jgi:5-(carboxyamino)imidazole ribonucleotide synthase
MALPPGSTIGILGVGQLGRMLAAAAAKLGFQTAVYGPEADRAPAGLVATRAFSGAYEDQEAVREFAAGCDAVTYEFENVPAAAAAAVTKAGRTLAPCAPALAVSQERLAEKQLFRDLGIGTVPFWGIATAGDLKEALGEAGPSILKTCRFGYDGKGQTRLSGDEDPAEVLADLGGGPWILEKFAPFTREVSQIAARGGDGRAAFYPLAENTHRDGILHRSVMPAPNAENLRGEAERAVRAVLEHLDYVGVLTVEFFEVDGRLLANEMAPRVHNSGHHTIEACSVSQFEQHILAVAGWPLREPRIVEPSEMINLIGPEADDWASYAGEPKTSLTLYGKRQARAGRKMGHLVRPLG